MNIENTINNEIMNIAAETNATSIDEISTIFAAITKQAFDKHFADAELYKLEVGDYYTISTNKCLHNLETQLTLDKIVKHIEEHNCGAAICTDLEGVEVYGNETLLNVNVKARTAFDIDIAFNEMDYSITSTMS